ncbi:MAG: hypothetical protein ACOCXH_05255 [Cyclobacteriaceae bacterium]
MKRLNYLFATLIAGGMIFSGACTDEETIDKTAILMDTLWDTSVLDVTVGNAFASQTIDVIEQVDDCTKDDLIDFISASEYNILDSDLSCSSNPPADGILFTGTWSYDQEADQLELDADYFGQLTTGLGISIDDLATNGTILFDVVDLTENKVELEFSKVVPVSDPTTGISIDSDLTIEVTLIPAS